MSLFDKFKKNSPVKTPDTNNAHDNAEIIIDRIITVLHPLAGGAGAEDLTLWVNGSNQVLLQLLRSSHFSQLLVSKLLDDRLDQFASGQISVQTSAIPEGLKATTILPGEMYLSFGKYVQPKVETMTKAWLRLVNGTGNSLQPDLLLDPAQKKIWHIGRGQIHRGSTSVRRNDYVVNDGDPTASTGAVSHAHCDIVYDKGAFYLQACPGGCRNEGGSATKIIVANSDKLIELQSSTLRYPLHSGDTIELSKTVLIDFLPE